LAGTISRPVSAMPLPPSFISGAAGRRAICCPALLPGARSAGNSQVCQWGLPTIRVLAVSR
jgi:hypothetical protein